MDTERAFNLKAFKEAELVPDCKVFSHKQKGKFWI